MGGVFGSFPPTFNRLFYVICGELGFNIGVHRVVTVPIALICCVRVGFRDNMGEVL